MSNFQTKTKILFQMSGSIACFKACALLSKLAQSGHNGGYDIEVVATPSALNFVGEATLEGLTGKSVHKATFEAGGYMDHIHLMRWADLIILCPATANTLNKLAAGIGDDLLSTMFLAHDFKKPYLIAPAMNQFMFAHPSTQSSIAKLQSWGIEILGTGVGNLACGEVGEGRMLEPEQIQAGIEQALAQKSPSATSGRKLLITSGGTEEPIDGVRSIKNISSGRTGAELARWFADHGDQVTLLHSKAAILPENSNGISMTSFTSFSSLQAALKSELSTHDFDAVLHLAAVADYSVNEVEANGEKFKAPLNEKIDSGEQLTLRLKKNPKLIDTVRSQSKNSKLKIVAFKLTSTDVEQDRKQAVAALSSHAHADFIVHNDATQISSNHHPFTIYSADKAPLVLANVVGAQKLAIALDQFLGGSL